ncbi:hypothetical protein HI914_03352 [Erysiphe necator]|nr:hypothetical protein HI914_03352 [Erysiphe necator]
MSSTVNKIKEALHISSGDRDLSKNESRFSHLGKPDSISSESTNQRSHVASGAETGHGLGTSNTTNYTPGLNSGNTTHHTSNLANKLDPRVDSTSSYQYQNTRDTVNSSNAIADAPNDYLHASNEAPHKSGILNKLDPRVDSNLSGRESFQGRASGNACNTSDCYVTNDPGKGPQSQGIRPSHQQSQNLDGYLDNNGYAKRW